MMRQLGRPWAFRRILGASGSGGWPLDVLAFTQSISGTNVVTNGDMETGDPPTDWALAGATLDGVADERTGGAGAQSLLMVGTGGDITPQASRSVAVTANRWYLFRAWLKGMTTDTPYVYVRTADATRTWFNPPSPFFRGTSWGRVERSVRTAATSHSVRCNATNTAETDESHFDDVGLYLVTLNGQQTLPSANAEIVVDIDLPVSGTYVGQFIEVYYRISGTLESGFSCWVCRLRRNSANDNWVFELESVSSSTETARASLPDIGTPTALKVVCYGSQHQVYAYIDGEWAALHDVVSVSHNDAETGVNVIYSAEMTPGRLRARAASPFDAGLAGAGLVYINGDSKSDETASYGYWPPMFIDLAQRAAGQVWTRYNDADGGGSLATQLATLAADLAARADTPEPDAVLFNVGANDVEGVLVEATWKNNLRTFVETIHAKWATVSIYIMRPWRQGYDAESAELSGWIDAVAGEYAYVYAGPDENVFLKSDDDGAGRMLPPYPNAHPNGYGSILTARAWRDVLW